MCFLNTVNENIKYVLKQVVAEHDDFNFLANASFTITGERKNG